MATKIYIVDDTKLIREELATLGVTNYAMFKDEIAWIEIPDTVNIKDVEKILNKGLKEKI